MIVFQKKNLVMCVCVMVAAVAGCDQIQGLLQPKTGKKKAVVSTQAATPSSTKTASANEDKNAPLASDVLAKVGDWTMPLEEFNQRIAAVKKQVPDFDDKDVAGKKMILEELVRQQLLIQDARAQGMNRKKEIVEATRDFENNLLVQAYVSELTKDVKADEAEAKAYYDGHGDEFLTAVEKRIREVVVPTEAEAKDVLVQALQGADFTALAKERSKGKSAANGGDLGFLSEAPFPGMLAAVQSLGKGGVSAVFQGPEGYYVVKLEDVRGGDKVPLADIKEDLLKALTIQKQQKTVADKLKEIKTRIVNKTNPDLLGKTGE